MENKRLTLNVPTDKHKILKMFCIEMGVSMKSFVLEAAFDKLDELYADYEKRLAGDALKTVEESEAESIAAYTEV